MYITRPDGRVVEIDDPDSQNMLLMKAGWRESLPAEIESYKQRKKEFLTRVATETSNDPGMPAAYYQTVASSPDGYGMSRDIIKSEVFQQGILLQEEFKNQKVGLLYSYPTGITQMRTEIRLIMTMFESDKIPEDWPEYLQMAEEVIVPSKWCADVFAKSGINATVVPLGYNDRAFQFIDRPLPVDNQQPFTFIHYSSFNIRKGFSEVLKAFTEEFKTNEPAKLILKTTERKQLIPVLPSQYPNIEVITDHVTEAELSAILGRAHCMVYPSRGEGFGITPLEAMATGLPAIVPNAHGISEYFNANYILEVKADERCPGLYGSFKGQDVGQMVVCDVADLRKQMRYAFNHQEEMKKLGRDASEYVKKYTYRETAARLAEIIKRWQSAEVIKRNDSKHLHVEVM
jgi:glycosyltransferase involved in cell wall biosynthesis